MEERPVGKSAPDLFWVGMVIDFFPLSCQQQSIQSIFFFGRMLTTVKLLKWQSSVVKARGKQLRFFASLPIPWVK